MTDSTNTKSIWKSKTFWFNILVGVMALLSTSFGDDSQVPEGGNEAVLFWLGIASAVINIFIRTITSEGISKTKTFKMFSGILLAGLILFPLKSFAEQYILVNDTGYWILNVPQTGEPTLIKPTTLGPGNGDAPSPPDNPPKPGALAEKISAYSQTVLTEKQIKGLPFIIDAVVNQAASNNWSDKAVNKAMETSLKMAGPVLGDRKAIENWYEEVKDRFGNGISLMDLLRHTSKGLTASASLTPQEVGKVLSIAAQPEGLGMAQEGQDVEASLEIAGLLALIKAIMEILEVIKDLDF